jgi:hypothetical protein
MSIAAVCVARAAPNAPARTVACLHTVTSAVPVTEIWMVAPNAVCATIAPQRTVGTVSIVTNVTT